MNSIPILGCLLLIDQEYSKMFINIINFKSQVVNFYQNLE